MKPLNHLLCVMACMVLAVTPITAQYSVRVEPDIYYGTAVNFAGCNIDLFLDLYKPVNAETSRPLMVLVHGGAFVAGERTDGNMVALANQMASRGHVVASVSYRLGWHTTTLSSGNCFCYVPPSISACLYAADTVETYRAAYRAMQDVKGAIRFLKNRSLQDSTNIHRVSVGGHSAGAVTSLLVGFMDMDTERPMQTYAQAMAPAPYVANACSLANSCGGSSRQRGDLGSIRGNLHLNGEDESVHAVMTFAGAIPDTAILVNEKCTPSLYVYHQSCDHIVPSLTNRFFRPVNSCLYYCCPQPACRQITGMPMVHGGEALVTHISSNPGLGINMVDDLVSRGGPMTSYYGCVNANPNINYCTNPDFRDCHDMLMDSLRYQNIANFLDAAPSLNPNVDCNVGLMDEMASSPKLTLYPNPNSGSFVVQPPMAGNVPVEGLECVDAMGRAVAVIWNHTQDGVSVQVGATAGVYTLRLTQGGVVFHAQLVKVE